MPENVRGTRWLTKQLRKLGFRTCSTGSEDEVFVRKYYKGKRIKGIVGRPNGYPASSPNQHYYLVLCFDWDRRANAYARRFFDPETMQEVFSSTLEVLAQGYDGPEFGACHDF